MADAAVTSDLPIADRAEALTLGYASGPARGGTGFWPLILFVVAVVLRLAFSYQQSSDPFSLTRLPDQIEYWLIGRSIIEHGEVKFDDPLMSQNLYAFRMPGYPLLVAACGGSLTAVRTVQALLDGSCVLAVFALARRCHSDRAAVFAGAAVAVHPYLVYFSSLVLSESLFTAMLMWGVLLLLSPRRAMRVGGIGLLLASVYVRPSAIGLGALSAIVVFMHRGVGQGFSRYLSGWRGGLAGGLAALALVVTLAPWAARNRTVLGRTIWTTTNSGYTAYDSFNAAADGSSNQAQFRKDLIDPSLAVDGVLPSHAPLATWTRQRNLGEIGRNDFFSRLAWQYAAHHPGRAVVLAGMKLTRFWAPWPLSAEFGGRWLYVVAGGGFVVPFFALVLVGIWRGGLGRKTTLVLLLPAIYFSLVHTVFVGSLRYRVPCDVPMAVLAGAGAASFIRPKKANAEPVRETA